ncbi:MAG: AIR carboxylase family protein, partial [Clostridia bacterium]
IAGAGGAAHLPGMVASMTVLPVIGVPVQSRALNGLDSLLSIVQMPFGVPVATVGINQSGNAALLAIKMLAIDDEMLTRKLEKFMENQKESVLKSEL